ncbi:hypothetical protein SFC65_20100 [Priestia filamentosa]|uniref:HNH endonuclease n=1 Tax=Priestia filamentosa TaxID=1402861 RepID=UPI003982019B
MIKINLNNAQEIKQSHLNNLKKPIVKTIDEEMLNTTDSHFKELLTFLKSRIDALLCGDKTELREIITVIETNYYIAERKLTNIISRRSDEIDGRRKKEIVKNGLSNYSRNNRLFEHLPSTSYCSTGEFKIEVRKLIDKWKNYNKTLENIFDYTAFSEAEDGWSAYELVSLLEVNVCPYCNRSYTATLRKESKDGKKTRPQLDHYYPKSRYPYLSLSFSNLIPSCSVCNSSLKGTIDFFEEEAIHPYEEEFLNVATFRTDFDKSDPYNYKYLLGTSKKFKIDFDINTTDENLKRKIENAIKTFALDRLYDTHQDFVRDLIRNAIVNNNSRIDEIYNEFEGTLFKSREEVMQSVFLNYMDTQGLGKRPLSKLTQDICKELGLGANSEE